MQAHTLFPYTAADPCDLILIVQKQAPVVEESSQENPPSYDVATENGPCSEDFLRFVELLCSSFISFLPNGCWETETTRVKCSADAYTASLAGTSIHNPAIILTYSYGLQLYKSSIAGTITHNPAVIYAFSYGLQLCKRNDWRANRISAASGPPRDDLSPIWIACALDSFWFAR